MAPTSSPPLSRERIVAAALELIDRDGLPALSLRALADHLAAGPMSLYRHIDDKADILDGVRARLLDDIRVPPPGEDWRADVLHWATAFRAVMRAHPHAVPLFTNRPTDAYLTARDTAEAALARLEAVGFAPREAALLLRSTVRFVIGFSLTDPHPGCDEPQVPAGLRAGGYPRLAALIEGAGADDERLFHRNLGAILDGFAPRIPDGPPVDRAPGGDTIGA